MNCPACNGPMITMELQDVEIDHCLTCGGIWLDAGELEILLDDAAKARTLLDSFRREIAVTERPRRCPICDKKMTKALVGRSKPALLIDACRRGDGLWFDRGELPDVVDRAQLDENNRVRTLLADMFGCNRSSQEQ
jgi:Zn-finger nucleic acid-binding protein